MRRSCLALMMIVCGSELLWGQAVPNLEPRVPVGKNASGEGMLLVRTGERPWAYADAAGELNSRDRLLALPGSRAQVEAGAGKVELTLIGNVPQLSTFAGFQSEVVLHDSRTYDLDFTLSAGRVQITSKKAGPVRVWVRLPGLVEGRTNPPEIGAFELTFATAGDSVALDVHGRWPQGVAFSRVPKPNVTPTTLMNLVVVKGSVSLKTSSYQYTLGAPPGLASLTWDSEAGPGGPQRLEELPTWIENKAAANKVVAEVLKKYETARTGRGPLTALLELIALSEKDEDATRAELCRRFAVFSLSSIDELPRVVSAVERGRWPEVRDVAIVALRHHIGERPGRSTALFGVLRDGLNYPEGTAEVFLQLLHSPFDPEQAEAFSTLLAYLRHPRTAVRELARWHLERYIPEGKKIGFDATGDETARDKAVLAWKKLIEERPKK